jgi:hypothetical protein
VTNLESILNRHLSLGSLSLGDGNLLDDVGNNGGLASVITHFVLRETEKEGRLAGQPPSTCGSLMRHSPSEPAPSPRFLPIFSAFPYASHPLLRQMHRPPCSRCRPRGKFQRQVLKSRHRWRGGSWRVVMWWMARPKCC